MSAQNYWVVPIECRKPGAIGEYSCIKFGVRADTYEEALAYAGETANIYGWETRGGCSVVIGPVSKEKQEQELSYEPPRL